MPWKRQQAILQCTINGEASNRGSGFDGGEDPQIPFFLSKCGKPHIEGGA